MESYKAIKERLYQELQLIVNKRVATAKNAMEAATEARDNETKSTAGDKHETGRAMMQIEQEKNKIQLIKAVGLKKEIDQINCQKIYDQAQSGSVVQTDQGNYFLSVGLGKIIIDGNLYYAISLASPIGRLLLHKKTGATVRFRDRTFVVKNVF